MLGGPKWWGQGQGAKPSSGEGRWEADSAHLAIVTVNHLCALAESTTTVLHGTVWGTTEPRPPWQHPQRTVHTLPGPRTTTCRSSSRRLPGHAPYSNCTCTQPSLLRKTFQEASYQERPFPFKFSLFQTFLNLTPLQCLQNLCQKPDRTSVPCRGPFGECGSRRQECGSRRQCVNQNVLFKCDFFHPEPPPRCL